MKKTRVEDTKDKGTGESSSGLIDRFFKQTRASQEELLRPIYTVRLCRMRQAYDRPTT